MSAKGEAARIAEPVLEEDLAGQDDDCQSRPEADRDDRRHAKLVDPLAEDQPVADSHDLRRLPVTDCRVELGLQLRDGHRVEIERKR